MIAIDLSIQQALNADPKSIQQINFTGNLDRAAAPRKFFIIKGEKDTILVFLKELWKSTSILFCFNIISM